MATFKPSPISVLCLLLASLLPLSAPSSLNEILTQPDTQHHTAAPPVISNNPLNIGKHHDDHKELHDNNKSIEDHHGNHTYHGIHVASIKFEYVRQPFILSIFMIVTVLAKIGFHKANFLSSWMPESCLLIILGVAVGAILHKADVDTSSFYYIDPRFFFLFLLPPCILEASYGLHDKVFFDNLGTIIVYAIFGTVLNWILVGSILFGLAWVGAMGEMSIKFIQCLVFSSLIVAVDPVAVLAIFQEIGVNNVLYFIVFGESLLNDAITVVLYNTITTLSKMQGSIPVSEIGMAMAAFLSVSFGGLLIGIIFGILTALITRLTIHVRVVEPLTVLSLSYSAYITAELFHFSGIISMIACGLVQMQYAFHNISNNSSITIKHFTKMLSGACDCIIFMFLGIAVVRDRLVWHTGFILWTVVLCLLVRFLVTYGLTLILNKTERKRPIGTKEQFIMAYGGLRGAVAFCLVALLDQSEHKDLFRTTTLVIIFFTVFVQGMTIKPLVKCLKIEGEEEKVMSLYHEINSHVMDHILMYMEELTGHYGYNSIQGRFNNLNDKYFKKILQRDPFTKDEVIMEIYQQIAIQQHYESVYGLNTSSQVHLYKPEFIRRQSMALNKIHGESITGGLLSSMVEAAMANEEGDRIYNGSLKRGSRQANRMSVSESESKTRNKWKSASKLIQNRTSVLTIDNDFVPYTLQIRNLLNKSSQRDAFSRHSDRNLLDGDKSDLWGLLYEKQQRHNRFVSNQSQQNSLANSKSRSLENINRMRFGKHKLNKHRTVDFDNKTHAESMLGSRFLSKRPVSTQGLCSVINEGTPLMPLQEEEPRAVEEDLSQDMPQQPPNQPFIHSTSVLPLNSLQQAVQHLLQNPPQNLPQNPPTQHNSSHTEADVVTGPPRKNSLKRQKAQEARIQDTSEECL